MNDKKYPLVTLTMEQYEKMNKEIERGKELIKELELTDNALMLALSYFDTEDEKVKLKDYIVSRTDKEIKAEKEICDFIKSKIHPINILPEFYGKNIPDLEMGVEASDMLKPLQHNQVPIHNQHYNLNKNKLI